MFNLDRTPRRWSHYDTGRTGLCFSEDGEFIITCGGDGEIVSYNGIFGFEQRRAKVGEKARAVDQRREKIIVAGDNEVKMYNFPGFEYIKTLMEFSAAVTTISVSKDGDYLAAASCDGKIKCIEISTTTEIFCRVTTSPVVHLTIDPRNEYLASFSFDGSIRIFNLKDQSKEEIVWSNNISPLDSLQSLDASVSYQICWESTEGKFLAVPCNRCINVYERDTWKLVAVLSNESGDKEFQLAAWSPCGAFIAASDADGRITIWKDLVNEVVSSSIDLTEKRNISSLTWNPDHKKEQLACGDFKGKFAMINITTSPPKYVLDGKIYCGNDVVYQSFEEYCSKHPKITPYET